MVSPALTMNIVAELAKVDALDIRLDMRTRKPELRIQGSVLGDFDGGLAAGGDDDVAEHAPVEVAAHHRFHDGVVQHAGDYAYAPEQFMDEGRVYG